MIDEALAFENFQSRVSEETQRDFLNLWEWMATECGSFLMQHFSLGSENPKEMQFFSFEQSDSKYSDFIQGHSTSSPTCALGVDALGVGAGH